MEIICTRPSCVKPRNFFSDLDTEAKIRSASPKYCTVCGMSLFLADRYIPAKLLGEGGFGAAFLACDRYKPKLPPCVVKQFKPANDLDADEVKLAQELFEREAVVLEELGQKHPQIPMLYAFFTPIVRDVRGKEQEQYFYLAQEFIDGQDLEQELEAKGKFSEIETIEVLTEILEVLEFVHQNNTIHRDIKPSNIMRNQEGVLYLLDFGAVKQIAAGGSNHKKSTSIYSMGFAPPEQMSGSQVYPATDIYALAVTCVNLLTGKSAEELYDSFNNSWQWHQYTRDLSDRLKQVLDKMLLPSAAQRFQSATEALEALNLRSPPTSSTPMNSHISPAPSTATHKPNQPIVSTVSTTHKVPAPFNVNIPTVPAVPNPNLITPTRKKRKQRPFSLVEVMYSAAFTGFEGALISFGLTSWLSVSGESVAIIGGIMGAIVFALQRRVIEKVDLIIFAAVTVALIAFVPAFHRSLPLSSILIIAMMSAAGGVAIVAFFRLVYQLLSRCLGN